MDAIYPKDLTAAHAALVAHLETKGLSEYDLVVRYKAYNGKHIRVRCSGVAIFVNGSPVSMSGIHKLLEVSDTPID